MKPNSMTQEKKLLLTMTGEIFHPTRLYYHLFDQNALLRIFSKLDCMDYGKTYDRWVWLYQGKARKLKFSQTPSYLPKQAGPIVLGSFFLRSSNGAHLDLRSFERATKAIVFFDKYIPRKVASVTDIAIVNACFDFSAEPPMDFNEFFETDRVRERKPEALLEELQSFKEITDLEERRSRVFSHIEAMVTESLPEVERFPVNYYEDGIKLLEASLRMRETVSLEHWKGNKDFTLFDIIGSVIR